MRRQLTLLDQCLTAFDVALRSICIPQQRQPSRMNPAKTMEEPLLSHQEKKHVAGLMRVNHAGEVCAQALYQGQALTARVGQVKEKMRLAALEEVDHLAWCEERLRELDSSTGILNPVWYAGSFMIGLLAGWVGDRWSLGFVVETERQVTEHLQKHLTHLPKQDDKTRALLAQMHIDETQHANAAQSAGAAELPTPIKLGMRLVAKLMTHTTYYI